MQSILEVLAIVAGVLFLLLGVASSLGGGSVHEQMIGGGELSMDHGGSSDEPEDDSEREREIRQMLEARSERLERQGKEALDIDAELSKLTAKAAGVNLESMAPGAYDPALIEETRQLVAARNERRRRAGLQELDVQAEVRRTLRELES
jgi:hypothetical protein